MADGEVVINTDIDDDGVERGLDRIKAKLATLNMALLQTAKISGAISLGSALIPVLAVATNSAVGLAASFAAAGIGAVAFGAVAVGALKQVFTAADEVAKLEEKIANADSAKERIAAQKELAEYYAGMSAELQGALQSLQNFKSFWAGFVKEFENPIFQMFSVSLQSLQMILEGLRPTISNVSDVVLTLVESFNQDLKNGEFVRFFEWLEVNAAEAIRSFAIIAGNLLTGFFDILLAFAPVGASMEEGLVRLTGKFKEWAAGLSQSNGFQKFTQYVKENGPVVMELIGKLVTLGKDLIVALAPLGAKVLEGITWLAGALQGVVPIFETIVQGALDFVDAIQENWVSVRETVIALGAAVGSAVLMFKGLQIIGIINGLLTTFRTVGLAATLAQMGLNAAMLMNPITWIVIAIAALIGIVVLLVRNWDWVKEKAGELWDWMKEVWSGIVDAVGVAVEAIKAWWEPIGQWFVELWNNVVEFFKTAWETIKAVIEVAWLMIQEVIRFGIEFVTEMLEAWGVTELVTNIWNGIKDFLSNVWEGIKTVATAVWGFIKSYFEGVFNTYKTIITTVWDFIKPYLQGAWEWIKGVATSVFEAIKSKMSEIWNSIKSTITGIWDSIKSAAVEKWNALKDTIVNKSQEAKSNVSSKFSEIKNAIMDPIRSAVDFVREQVGKIKGFFDNLKIKLPKIPLPHFSIKGDFSLKPPSVPKLSVDWYAQGGLFPANSPRLVGVGDNKTYQEAALPLSPQVLGMIGQKIADTMNIQGGNNLSSLPLTIENVLNIDGYEVARLLKEYLDIFQASDYQMQSVVKGMKP